jgi:hypothetical protein
MEVSFQLDVPAALLSRNAPWRRLDRGLVGPKSQSVRFGEEQNIFLQGL